MVGIARKWYWFMRGALMSLNLSWCLVTRTGWCASPGSRLCRRGYHTKYLHGFSMYDEQFGQNHGCDGFIVFIINRTKDNSVHLHWYILQLLILSGADRWVQRRRGILLHYLQASPVILWTMYILCLWASDLTVAVTCCFLFSWLSTVTLRNLADRTKWRWKGQPDR